MDSGDVERRLLRLMDRHGIGRFFYADGPETLSLQLDQRLHPEIRASQAGRFHSALPGVSAAPVFPRPVLAGDILGYLKIGPLLLPITATQDGLCPPPLKAEGDIVGYHEAIF